MKPKWHVGPKIRKGMKPRNKMMDDGQKFPWRVQVSGTANAVLADAKFPQGSFTCIITEYPIFIGLRTRTESTVEEIKNMIGRKKP